VIWFKTITISYGRLTPYVSMAAHLHNQTKAAPTVGIARFRVRELSSFHSRSWRRVPLLEAPSFSNTVYDLGRELCPSVFRSIEI
jgi:hypothetical protein